MKSCLSCVWHSAVKTIDADADTVWVWRCWRESGCPTTRLQSHTYREPVGCTDHYGGENG